MAKAHICLWRVTYLSNMTTASLQIWFIPILPSSNSFPERKRGGERVEWSSSASKKNFSVTFSWRRNPVSLLYPDVVDAQKKIIILATPSTLSGGSLLRIAASETFSSYPHSCTAATQFSPFASLGGSRENKALPEHASAQIKLGKSEE